MSQLYALTLLNTCSEEFIGLFKKQPREYLLSEGAALKARSAMIACLRENCAPEAEIIRLKARFEALSGL